METPQTPTDQRAEDQQPEVTPGVPSPEGEEKPQGGPSEEFKMQRLEKEALEAKERAKELEEALKIKEEREREAKEAELSPEERFNEKQKNFYKNVATQNVMTEMKESLEKLPKALAERIKKDPFNTAWFSEEAFELELMKLRDQNDPEQVWGAAERAFKKSFPGFVSEFTGTETPPAETPAGSSDPGNNPPMEYGDKTRGMSKDDLWKLPADEVLGQLKRMKGM